MECNYGKEFDMTSYIWIGSFANRKDAPAHK